MGHFETFFTNALSVADKYLKSYSTLKIPLIFYGKNSVGVRGTRRATTRLRGLRTRGT